MKPSKCTRRQKRNKKEIYTDKKKRSEYIGIQTAQATLFIFCFVFARCICQKNELFLFALIFVRSYVAQNIIFFLLRSFLLHLYLLIALIAYICLCIVHNFFSLLNSTRYYIVVILHNFPANNLYSI